MDFSSNGFFFNLLNLRIKKVIAKIQICLVCSSETLESKALIPNVMKLAHKIEEKRDQSHRNQHLQGGTSFTLNKLKILVLFIGSMKKLLLIICCLMSLTT